MRKDGQPLFWPCFLLSFPLFYFTIFTSTGAFHDFRSSAPAPGGESARLLRPGGDKPFHELRHLRRVLQKELGRRRAFLRADEDGDPASRKKTEGILVGSVIAEIKGQEPGARQGFQDAVDRLALVEIHPRLNF